MSAERLKAFLDENGIRYELIQHSPAFTSQEIAAAAHLSGRRLAKTVLVRIGGELAMVVVPGSEHVDLHRLAEITGRPTVLATEEEFRSRFPDCEVGAMPPFGNLYGMDVYVSEHVGQEDPIAFNAGTHRELIQMSYADFVRLAQPKKVEMAIAR